MPLWAQQVYPLAVLKAQLRQIGSRGNGTFWIGEGGGGGGGLKSLPDNQCFRINRVAIASLWGGFEGSACLIRRITTIYISIDRCGSPTL